VSNLKIIRKGFSGYKSIESERNIKALTLALLLAAPAYGLYAADDEDSTISGAARRPSATAGH